MKTWRVYALIDPRDNGVRYVGYTTANLRQRLANHCHQARRDRNSYKDKWILGLHNEGLRPMIQVLETGQGDSWTVAEPKWITLFRAAGNRLVNCTEGGEGAVGFVHSEESRRKRAVAMTGRKMPREAVERQAAMTRGRKVCRELVERRAAKQRGLKRSMEARKKIAEGKLGWNPSAATREKMAASQRARFQRSNPPRPRKIQHDPDAARCKCRDCVLAAKGNPGGRKRVVQHDSAKKRCDCMDCRIARKGKPIGKPRKPTVCRKCGVLCEGARIAEKHCSSGEVS